RLISSKMLPRHLCQCLFLRSLKLNSVNVAALASRIHSSWKKLSDSESEEQTGHRWETEELPQGPENKNFGELHTPVMLEEVVNCLSPQPGQLFLDMTFGAGGHSRALLDRASAVTVYALDRDPAAHAMAQRLAIAYPNQVQPLLGRFSEAEALLLSAGVEPGTLDGVLLDAGCSSMQLDTPQRGFSLHKDGPLDMRMDGDRYVVMHFFCWSVNCSATPSYINVHLLKCMTGAFPASALYARKDLLQRPVHVATKTFQALRIFVNDELHELLLGLRTAEKFLKPGGRLVALSFHSLEDRIIKRFLHGIDMREKYNLGSKQKIRRALKNSSKGEDAQESSCGKSNSKWVFIQKKVLTPQAEEVQTNPRGRSAKLRAAIKL
ncbi:MET15 protein, partial [Regulus satrapa]|nr:MET15 protein [Regulus satrapa]